MKLFVTRHGETEWNRQRKLCGTTDIPLSDTGEAQAQRLARALKDKNIDVIIASPLQRAQRTAHIVGDALGVPVETDARLIERSFGSREGSDYGDADMVREWPHFARRKHGGESILQVAARIYPFLGDIRRRYAGKNVLLVSHGAAIRVVNSYFHSMDNEEFSAFRTGNCEVREYDL